MHSNSLPNQKAAIACFHPSVFTEEARDSQFLLLFTLEPMSHKLQIFTVVLVVFLLHVSQGEWAFSMKMFIKDMMQPSDVMSGIK